jgi:hypothetical protein
LFSRGYGEFSRGNLQPYSLRRSDLVKG